MKSEKAQVTYFILIGVVLIIIVFVLMHIHSTFMKKEAGTAETEAYEDAAYSATGVEQYLKNCVKLAAESGLILLGKQGGAIYVSQGGTFPDFDPGTQLDVKYVKHDGFDVVSLLAHHGASPPNPENVVEPDIDSMRRDLSSNISKSIISDGGCLKKLSQNFPGVSLLINGVDVKDAGADDVIIDTAITPTSLVVSLGSSLELVSGGATSEVSGISVPVTVRIDKILAKSKEEMSREFSEFLAQRLMANINLNVVSGLVYSDATGDIKIEYVGEKGRQDLFKTTDTASRIGGSDYEFYFARGSRVPYINFTQYMIDGIHSDWVDIDPSNPSITVAKGDYLKLKIVASQLDDPRSLDYGVRFFDGSGSLLSPDPSVDQISPNIFGVYTDDILDAEKIELFAKSYYEHAFTINLMDILGELTPGIGASRLTYDSANDIFEGTVGTKAVFDCTSKTTGGTPPYVCDWTFNGGDCGAAHGFADDECKYNSASTSPNHYSVTLKVTDNIGRSKTLTKTIKINS